MEAAHPTPARMKTAPQIEIRAIAFVLRLKICDISFVGLVCGREFTRKGKGRRLPGGPSGSGKTRRYFAQQTGSAQQLPQHESPDVDDVAEATVPRAATRTKSRANRDFFMGFSSEQRLRCFSDI